MVDCRKIAELACSKWFAYQNPLELEYAARTVQRLNPKVILEIGVAHGASIATWAAITDSDLVIGIDPCVIPKTPEQQESFDVLIEQYNIKMIPFFSTADEAHEMLVEILNGRKIDFLFIDGGHGYHDVSYDFSNYKKYLKIPSIIGFHDIYYCDKLADLGSLVSFYWERLVRNSNYTYDMFYCNSTMGIGIIYLNEQNKAGLLK